MRKIGFASVLILALSLLISCSEIMGYSVLLWNLPNQELQDGDIVPVYIKSNISNVYVIGTASGKIEVPLWQLTEPQSKRKAHKTAVKFSEYRHKYAYVALDGLPMRAEPVNTAKQVYRLRRNENVKILYKGSGQPVMSGQKQLEGDWLRILTEDGTQGWCFSYNLRPFETDKTGQMISGETPEETEIQNDEIDGILSKAWYPDSYLSMINSGRIDPSRLIPSYNFSLNQKTQKLLFTMPKIHGVWDYTGAVKTDDRKYTFNDIPITITVRNDSFIVLRYVGEDGKPEDFNLVAIDDDLNALVQAEKDRRRKEFEQIFMTGPLFRSSNYGQLTLHEDQTFTWNNNRLLVPSVISSSARNGGTVSINFFLSRNLAAVYDGVLTFKFEGMNSEVNFLYKMEEGGLRLEDATGAAIKNNIITERGLSPLVLFFSKGS